MQTYAGPAPALALARPMSQPITAQPLPHPLPTHTTPTAPTCMLAVRAARADTCSRGHLRVQQDVHEWNPGQSARQGACQRFNRRPWPGGPAAPTPQPPCPLPVPHVHDSPDPRTAPTPVRSPTSLTTLQTFPQPRRPNFSSLTSYRPWSPLPAPRAHLLLEHHVGGAGQAALRVHRARQDGAAAGHGSVHLRPHVCVCVFVCVCPCACACACAWVRVRVCACVCVGVVGVQLDCSLM